ncbi:MAG: ABC transporter ATP-binding protein [Dehalococcoidia bacterium]|nr:ABC transporter ATP-binding protein [Dehalococcoidia bacterium]
MSIVEARGLTKKFGALTAVDDLSLDVEEGEVLGFLGPNGAGKTNTIHMLAGIIAPTSGHATVAGLPTDRDVERLHEVIGLLTERPGLYSSLSARRNLEYFAGFYEGLDARLQVEKYLKTVGLWDRREDRVGTFSKGMGQRLALARALLHEPRVVFLPTMIAINFATFSIVDEKLSGSLEPLLATPVRTWELLLGKALAGVIPALIITWVCAGIHSPGSRAGMGTSAWPGPLALLLHGPVPSHTGDFGAELPAGGDGILPCQRRQERPELRRAHHLAGPGADRGTGHRTGLVHGPADPWPGDWACATGPPGRKGRCAPVPA